MDLDISGIDAERLRHHLGEGGLVTLAGGHQADRGVDRARRLDFHPARLVAGAGNAGRLVECRTVGGRLDDATQAEAAMDAAGAVARLAFAEGGDVEDPQCRFHGLARRDVLDHEPRRHGERQVRRLQHVEAAHLDGIAPEPARDRLDGPFHHPAGDRHRRAHRAVAAFVGQRDLDVEGVVVDPIRPGQDHPHHAGEIVRRVEAVGAEVLSDLEFQRQDAAVAVDRGAGARDVLACVTRRHQVLGAVLSPAHRAAELPRQQAAEVIGRGRLTSNLPKSIHWNFMRRGGFWYQASKVSARSLAPGRNLLQRTARPSREGAFP